MPDQNNIKRWVVATALVGALIVMVGIVASIGGPHGPLTGLASVVLVLTQAGWLAGVYLLGAFGIGRVAAPILRKADNPNTLQLAVGIGLMLWLSHLLGVAGLLGGAAGRYVALGVPVLGLLLLAHQLRGRDPEQWPRLPWLSVLALPGLVVMIVAACNPPGWLWASEFGGYDALSYHLQLPKEWLEMGRLWPLQHNVYSHLPSSVESAYMHLGAMSGSMLAGGGSAALASQLLHAGLGIVTAILSARVVATVLADTPLAGGDRRRAATLGGVLILSVPWVVVVGSLAYNELGVTAMFSGAVLVAVDRGLSPGRRGLIAGLLVGAACGAKPTAMLHVAAPVALILLGTTPVRSWARLAMPGLVAGCAMLAPWLVRNWIATGNPVFPAATFLFGSAHWSSEQVARFAAAHTYDGTFLDRLRLLVAPDPAAASGAPAWLAQRGLMHPQWSITLPLLIVCEAIALTWKPIRRLAALIGLGLLIQIATWMFVGHLQSRFLLPVVVPAAVLFGLAQARLVAAMRQTPANRIALNVLGAMVVLVCAITTVTIFAGQRPDQPKGHGRPNALLPVGPDAYTGAATDLDLPLPQVFINRVVPRGVRVYLLGDATPFYYTGSIVYNTTWDTSPLGRAIREHPDDPAAWTKQLRQEGISLVLVSESELRRLTDEGWYDPAVTIERVRAWIGGLAPVRTWPGRVLLDLRRARTTP